MSPSPRAAADVFRHERRRLAATIDEREDPMHDQRLMRSLGSIGAITLAALACGLYFDFGSPAPPSPTQPEPTAPPSLPTAIPPEVPAPTTQAPTASTELGAPESIDAASFPESFGKLQNRDGKWYLEDRPVVFAYHLNKAGDRVTWLTLENHTDWPILIQETDGSWALGVEAWEAGVTLINTNDVPVRVTISSPLLGEAGQAPIEQDLAPYELLDLASLPPGAYEFHFRFQAPDEVDLSCALTLNQESRFTFAAIPSTVAIAEAGFTPASGRDLDIRTSPLCRGAA
jgi:hypothetical protein